MTRQMAHKPPSLLNIALRALVLEALAFGLVIGAVWLLLSL